MDYLVVYVIACYAALAFAGIAAPLLGRSVSYASSLIASAITMVLMVLIYSSLYGKGVIVFSVPSMTILDRFGVFVLFAASLATLIAVYGTWTPASRWAWSEAVAAIAALLLLGIAVMATTLGYITLYAAWILAAAASYIIVALAKDSISAEAAAKYGIMGGVASTMLVLGLGYLFASTNSSAPTPIAYPGPFLIAASIVTVVAIGYKLGVVPFHGWLPDVYGNARPFLLAIIVPLAKAIGVILLVRLLVPAASIEPQQFFTFLAVLAVVTMTYGNVAALASDNPQKVLAYSSMAQAGYLLAGIAALANLPGLWREAALTGLALQVLGYMLAKASVFLALDYALEGTGTRDWQSLHGLWRRSPLATTGMVLGLASLLGMPPSLGFWGKLYIVLALIEYAPLLVLIMVINFAIGAFYYARLINLAFTPSTEVTGGDDTRTYAALVAGALTLILGLLPWIAAGIQAYGY